MDFPKKQAQRLMPLYLLEYSEKLFENHPDPEAPWGGGGGSPIEAGTGIDITGDETKTISIDETVVATKTDLEDYVTNTTLTATLEDYELKSEAFSGDYDDLENKPDLSIYAESADLATVATTGDYDDLQNKPNIPVSTSDLINNSGYITKSVNNLDNYTLTSSLATVATSGSYNDLLDKPTIPSIPVTDVEVNGVSALSGTVAEITVPTDTSDLTNSAGFITSSAIPTNVSAFNNDANYVTATTLTAELANYVPSSSITTVAYTGSYNDLTDKPTIPTNTSDLNNDSGFITSSDIANDIEYIDLGSGSYPPAITQTIVDKIATNPKKYILLYRYTNGRYTYGLNFSLVYESSSYYGYECYCVKRYSAGGFSQCSEGFGLTIGKSPITSSLTQWTVGGSSYNAGTGINISGTTISVDTSTVAMQSDLTGLVSASSLSTVAFTGAYSDLSGTPSLATVATSGSYNDLTDTPTIGHGVLTIKVNGVNIKQFSANETAAKTADITVPTKTSDLNNDSGFITGITSSDITTALGYTPTNPSSLATVATTGAYSDLTGTPSLATVATSGSYADLSNKPDLSIYAQSANLATVATSGSYNDLSDKPTIPTVPTMTVLYTDSTTTVAGKDVVLSDSADNYDYLDVVMSISDGSFSTSFTTDRIYKDSGTSTTFVGKCFTNKIMGYWAGGTGDAYNKIGFYTFTSNTNIQVSGCGSTGTYRQIQWTSKNGSTAPARETNGTDGQRWVKITKVIGYKW